MQVAHSYTDVLAMPHTQMDNVHTRHFYTGLCTLPMNNYIPSQSLLYSCPHQECHIQPLGAVSLQSCLESLGSPVSYFTSIHPCCQLALWMRMSSGKERPGQRLWLELLEASKHRQGKRASQIHHFWLCFVTLWCNQDHLCDP